MAAGLRAATGMGTDSNDAYARRRLQRAMDLSVSRDFYAFVGGKGGVSALARFVDDENLVLSDRLRTIDAAIARGVITEEELATPMQAPKPEDFGLASGSKAQPMIWFNLFGGIYYIFCILGFFSLWITIPNAAFNDRIAPEMRWLLAGTSILAAAFIWKGREVMWALICSLFPDLDRRKRYVEECMKHDVLAACRTVRRFEGDVRIYHAASGYEFERLVARAFRRRGWVVQEMGGANDGGIDLLASKGTLKAIIQCKAHKKQIAPAVIRELFGTLSHSDASLAILASTNGPSAGAREWALQKPIRFLSPDDLIIGRGF